MTNPVYDKLRNCYDSIKDEIPFEPKVALVLGSGLGDYAEQLEIQGTIDYHDIEGFPVSTVPGHKGRFVFARINEVPAVLMQGRVHYYEGYSIKEISKLLQIPLPTVGTRLSRGRERLRQLLKEDVE